MSHIRAFKQKLAEVARLWERKDFGKALAVVNAMREAWPGNAHLQVLWARLVQMGEECAPALCDARQVLHEAAELEPESATANLELGHFLNAVEDDAQAASRVFARATAAARAQLIESLLGEARTHLELNRHEAAIASLIEALSLSEAYGTVKGHTKKPLDIVWRGPNGRIQGGQVAGPFAREIEELLNAVFLNRSA